MKVSIVFLIFFFSGIIFVGVVNDILAYDLDYDGPYTSLADVHRFGGGLSNDRLHVSMFASAASSIFGINGSYTLELDVDSAPGPTFQWEALLKRRQHDKFSKAELDVYGRVDGEFYDSVRVLRQFEEYPCLAMANAWGERTGQKHYSASSLEIVYEMPPPADILVIPYTYTATLAPAAGYDYFATAGDIHEAILTTNPPYYYVMWYVKTPGDTSERGTLVETHSGDTIQAEARFHYTFPSGVAGEYTITAVVREGEDVSSRELSYNVSVTLPTGIYPTNTVAAGASPGKPYELKVITDESFYWINWYVKRADETGLGTWVESDSGSSSNEATMSHTYNAIGDYIITAVIWRISDNSRYEETYNLRCDS